ncbi:hypothetical protein NEMBOFW57_007814 [Staphylotrichum longicolle]|uniref:NAD(P)-binding domain-containing protein n=1 Tax=Staphylotrichum longicolle TaxID=669026 RepID=A0AAD4EVB3_9PEZI|nr:hypothetical protein NEMBOFW57_007814 [Staphylotrichum longicolle]
MVKIAVAGPGRKYLQPPKVAHEIIDGLLATGKHEITLLARKDPTPELEIEGTTWVKVDYLDRPSLVKALTGVHTVLSFIVAHKDIDNVTQKALIDASIEAGVKRIAPSEWALAKFDNLDWYHNKLVIREYLKEKNKNGKVIEYTLFQPDNRVSYTAIADFVNIVVKAIAYEGEWPKVGGINGQTLSLADEIAIARESGSDVGTGKPYEIETLDVEDLRAGIIKPRGCRFWPIRP